MDFNKNHYNLLGKWFFVCIKHINEVMNLSQIKYMLIKDHHPKIFFVCQNPLRFLLTYHNSLW